MDEEIFKAKVDKKEFAVVTDAGKMYGGNTRFPSISQSLPAKLSLLNRRGYSLISPEKMIKIYNNFFNQKYEKYENLSEKTKKEYIYLDQQEEIKKGNKILNLDELRVINQEGYDSFSNVLLSNKMTKVGILHLSREDAVRLNKPHGFYLIDNSPLESLNLLTKAKKIIEKVDENENYFLKPRWNTEKGYFLNIEEVREISKHNLFIPYQEKQIKEILLERYFPNMKEEMRKSLKNLEPIIEKNQEEKSYLMNMQLGGLKYGERITGRENIILSNPTISSYTPLIGVKKNVLNLESLTKKENLRITQIMDEKGVSKIIHEFWAEKEEQDRTDFLYKLSKSQDIILPWMHIPKYENYYEIGKKIIEKNLDNKYSKEIIAGAIFDTYHKAIKKMTFALGGSIGTANYIKDLQTKKLIQKVFKNKNSKEVLSKIKEVEKIIVD